MTDEQKKLYTQMMGHPPPEDSETPVAPVVSVEKPTTTAPSAHTEAPAEAPAQDQQEDPILAHTRKTVGEYQDLFDLSKDQSGGVDDSLNKIQNKIMNPVTAMEMGAGHYAGKVLRKIIPEEYQYDPSIPEIEKTHLPKAEENLGKFHEDVMDDIERKNAIRDQHIEEGRNLKSEADSRRSQLQLTERELAQAREDHLKAKQLTPEHFLPAEQVETKAPAPARVDLNIKPIGGSATEKYGLAHGLTEDEAKRVASPSMVQKQNLPSQAEAFERLKSIAPNVVMSEESNLALDPAAQKVVEERKAAQLQQQAQEQRQAEQKTAQRQAAVQKVNDLKEAAKERIDLLERQRKENLDAVLNADKEHRQHMSRLPQQAVPTPEQKNLYDKMSDEVEALRTKVAQQTGSGTKTGKVLKYVATKLAPSFAPYYGSAMAIPQAAAAKEEFDKGNKIRGGLYTLGSLGAGLQATANPYAMGAGDLMQIPSHALAIHDIIRGD